MRTVLIAICLLLAAPLAAQDHEITRWTIAGGGVMQSSGGDWTLSGTIDQWEATEPRALGANQWSLTGGFWADILEELSDLLFSDRFEADDAAD